MVLKKSSNNRCKGFPYVYTRGMTSTTNTFKAQKVVSACYINNGSVYIMNCPAWIAVDSDNNAIAFGTEGDGPSRWRTKTAANTVATTITGTPKTVKVYETVVEAAKAEVV